MREQAVIGVCVCAGFGFGPNGSLECFRLNTWKRDSLGDLLGELLVCVYFTKPHTWRLSVQNNTLIGRARPTLFEGRRGRAQPFI